MKPKPVKHDYKEQLIRRNKELQGQATYVREKPTDQKPPSNARELFKPGRFTGEGCGMFPTGKLPKGDAPKWVLEQYGNN